MELSPKAVRFIIEALDYKIKAYEEIIEKEEIHENEASEINNDVLFLAAICEDLAKALQHLE